MKTNFHPIHFYKYIVALFSKNNTKFTLFVEDAQRLNAPTPFYNPHKRNISTGFHRLHVVNLRNYIDIIVFRFEFTGTHKLLLTSLTCKSILE